MASKSSFYSGSAVTPTQADAIEASVSNAATSASAASTSETNAANSASASEVSKDASVAAKSASETSANNAASSASTALTRANSATASASTATTKASEASSSASSSLSNKNATDTAKANAVTAQNASVSAKDASVAAKDASVAAKDASVAAKDASVAAKNASVIAKDASIAAKDASVAAKNSSETAASNSSSSASTATTRANTATAKADIATAKATIATDKAAIATTKASDSATSATASASSASASQTSRVASEAALDSFTDIYLGSKSSAPSTDNDGNSLATGAIYWHSGQNQLYIWNGSAFVSAVFTASGAVSSFNSRNGAVTLSSTDVTNASGLLRTGGAMTGAITTNSTFDGRDVAADGVLATNALPKAGGAMTGAITTNSTFDGRDVATDGSKLDSIEASATADQTKADIQGLGIDVPANNLTGTIAAARLSTATTQAESDDSTKIATTAYVVDKITTLIGGAPSTLNDLNELAAAINDDASYNSTLTTALGTKLPKAGGTMTGNLTFGNNNKAIFGAGSALQIFHDGSSSIIADAGTGNLQIRANDFQLLNAAGSQNIIRGYNSNGKVGLHFGGGEKLATTSAGIAVTGTTTSSGQVKVTSSSASAPAFSVGDAGTGFYNTGTNSIGLSINGANKLQVNNSGNVGIGTSSPSSFYSLARNLVVGTGTGGNGMTIYSGSSDSGYIGFNDTASNAMQAFIQYNHNGNYMAFAPNGSEKMRIDNSGNVTVGKTTIATNTVGAVLRANGEVRGTAQNAAAARFSRLSSDGEMVGFEKDGASIGNISVTGGNNLTISGTAGDHAGLIFATHAILPAEESVAASANAIDLGADGNEFKNLYLDTSIITSSDFALDVTGNLTLDAGGGDIFLKQNGVHYGSIKRNNGDLQIHSEASNEDILFVGNDGGNAITALTLDMSDAGSAHFNTSIYLGDGKSVKLGASADLQIYHDGSNSYIQDQGTGNLNISGNDVQILNAASNEAMAYFAQDGGVTLYHNGASKLATTSSGVTVTGTVTATAFAGSGANLTGVGASTAYGAVGTYTAGYIAFDGGDSAQNITRNDTVSGSAILTAIIGSNNASALVGDFQNAEFPSRVVGSSLSGTWRAMTNSNSKASSSSRVMPAVLFVRIS